MTEQRDAATEVLILTVLGKEVAKALTQARRRAQMALDQPGMRDMGVVGDEQIGAVQLKNGATSFKVSDPAALLAWVKANHPTEVHTVEQVRDTYITALIHQAKAVGAPVTKDGEEIPGIERHDSDPNLEARPSPDAAQVIGAALASGALTLPQVLGAIEATS